MSEIVVEVWPIANAGSLVATATVVISTDFGDVTFKHIRVIRGKSGNIFVALPQERYTKDGTDHYADLIIFPLKLKREIDSRILAEIDANES